jgi:hypothetical protein
MAKRVLRTGKKVRPKTAVKGKRFRCAVCRKRSPKPVKTPAPWYCPICRPPAAMLESLEDRTHLAAAKKALTEKGNIPWAEVKKRLGLKTRG